MAFSATQIRRGMVIVFENDPCRILEFRHHTPGNLRAMVQAKLKNLRTGSSFEHRFRAADTIERASMETHDLEFLYKGGETYHFMVEVAGPAGHSRTRENVTSRERFASARSHPEAQPRDPRLATPRS